MATLIERREQGRMTPFAPDETNRILDFYHANGYAHLPGILSGDEADSLRAEVDAAWEKAPGLNQEHLYGEIVLTRLFEFSNSFRDLFVREPLIGLMEALLGEQCHVIANNCIRNPPGKGIINFHADDFVWTPLPEEIPRFDPRIRMPCFLVNLHFALTNIETEAHGPLQVVPGSHYSGRPPNDPSTPSFEGRGPVSVLARKGDAYLQHPQVWHRGAPNTSDRTRYVAGMAYGMRFIAQRFWPFLNYRVPDHVLEGADERLLRVLGKHPKGAYG